MIETEEQLLQFLREQEITYHHFVHPPVFTCDEAERLRPITDASKLAVSTKNLFLTDKKAKRIFLLMTDCAKRMDLKSLAQLLGVTKLRFGSEERLAQYLGVTRGAVTVMGLVNDVDRRVELWIDEEIWDNQDYLCHPLVNTATLVLSRQSLEQFFRITGHQIHMLPLPD